LPRDHCDFPIAAQAAGVHQRLYEQILNCVASISRVKFLYLRARLGLSDDSERLACTQ
jgi:hypothetical protein